MAQFAEPGKYDEALTSILVNEKSIVGFLSSVFNFLARRTDFYHVPKGPYENMGFPPGVAEELVLKVLRKCDPKNVSSQKPADINDEIMCSTVAQEVEIIADDDKIEDSPKESELTPETKANEVKDDRTLFPEDYEPPIIPTQKDSESYNGAVRDTYSWSQTIMDLDITVRLPPDIKSSKDLKLSINPNDLLITKRNGETILKDTLPFKIKTIESFWTISEKKLLIHLEKAQERWWKQCFTSEEEIDLSKIDCSRSLNELPEDHIAKVHELQWNQEQKYKGLPTSDEIKNMNILKKAWNAPGSPFQGKEFDPNVLKNNINLNN
ncbi:nudC domain-containing protein 3 [Aricia agestis]|uniref:nudC domain-containing protein 3 n=1 Tax=Aricia agestis TaxID=91739 RepID=UPI001C20BB54|nr:nudC domain-containing protein 3 [Aricia agestis]